LNYVLLLHATQWSEFTVPPANPATTTNSASGWALVGIAGEGQPLRKVIVGAPEVLVGRMDDTNFRIDFRGVSKRHAFLRLNNGVLSVVDLQSTNGTFVNGRRIADETVLDEGDIVQFGNVPFTVTRGEQVQRAPTQAEIVVDRALAMCQFERLMSQRAVHPHFQPIVEVGAPLAIGYEVLARSRFVGLETATELFDAAAYVQQEVALSRMLREEGARLGLELSDAPRLFLNTHPAELGDEQLIPSLQELRASFPQTPMVLEIHEAAVADLQAMAALHAELKLLDIELAYDDFGAGQARLVELVEVPPNYLKFDRRLIQAIHTAPPQRQQMLGRLVAMVDELGIIALAEGVECSEEAEVCRQLGFRLLQGFHCGRPQSAIAWRDRTAVIEPR
jgi:EAL domain-containing protein (putative c-di-GMP-specific phosphodiesterase class I)